jgi:predicted small lipoprotein YifL
MRLALTMLFTVTCACACGYKGPLYLPKPPAGKPPTVVLPEPAPDRPLPAEAVPPPK